ncbi:MAG: Cof-type HAD-IIB family hydrolase [Lachnospiraceae bacterium]|nr:Cof-type HAD-IIB family hydrolase [Lachnospiraceae bacterium]
MIKLIATDIDGTLIQDSTPDLYPEIEEEIRRLTDLGIIFVCASGRQYASIKNVFRAVSDRIVYIAENGAHIRYQDRDLSLTEMRRDYVEQLILQLRNYPDCEMVVSTPTGSLLETDNQEFLDLMTYGYHNTYRVVKDVLAENEPILKVAIYQKNSIRQLGESVFIPEWGKKLKTCVAGEEWVDFMDLSVDKGNAIIFLQKFFGITKSETMAFGDNTNDIGLIQAAGESYAVENARPELKALAKYICPSWKEKGVWQIVRRLKRNDGNADSDVIDVNFFGGFRLMLNGTELKLDKTSTSKPMQLLAILLHVGEDGISREELQEALYGKGKVEDQTNNLKQTVFRLRKLVAASTLPEDTEIMIEKSRYCWKSSFHTLTDTQRFKNAFKNAETESEEKKKLHYLKEACDIYQGEFFPRLQKAWALTERQKYREMYYKCLKDACSILKQEERYEEVLDLCVRAEKVYPNEEWSLESLDCLIALGRYQEAQQFYKKTTEYYSEELHNNYSDEMRERHEMMRDRIRNAAGTIEDIQRELTLSGKNIHGTYYCTYPNFEGICNQIVRNNRGVEEHATLLLCTMLNEKKGTPLTEKRLSILSEKLQTAIWRNLRKSDCFTRYSDNQFLILLVNCNPENAVFAQKRIMYYMEREYGIKNGICYDIAVLK